MDSITKVLCLALLVVVSSINPTSSESTVNLQYVCNQNETFDLILGTEKGLSKMRSCSPKKPEPMFQFKSENIRALARYNDQLFVADNRDSDGYVYRCKIDWSKFETEDIYCSDRAFLSQTNHTHNVRNIMAVGGFLYVSASKYSRYNLLSLDFFHLCRCSTEKKDQCDCHNFDELIHGIAHDARNKSIYVTLKSGKLLRIPNEANIHNSTLVYENGGEFTSAVHVAFDSVWIGTDDGKLLKCPVDNSKDYLKCEEFAKIPQHWYSSPDIYSIASRNGLLYASLKGLGKHDMWQCMPNVPGSCKTMFKLPDGTQSFLIVN